MNFKAKLVHEILLQINLAHRLVEYFTQKGYILDRNPGEVNILYLEGADVHGYLNADEPDKWNDRSIILMFDELGLPYIAHNSEATTEPGRSSTLSAAARKLGGVARVMFGQFRAWRVGWHNQGKVGKTHPALVQRATLMVHRDANQDGKRTGDPIAKATGVNQHSTSQEYKGTIVGGHSAGCMVRRFWERHLHFMGLVLKDPRYLADPDYLFLTAIIDAGEFHRMVPPKENRLV